MEMIEVFDGEKPVGFEVHEVKEYNMKYRFTAKYKGMVLKKCELPKLCAIGYEKQACRSAVKSIVAMMYAEKGDSKAAMEWLNKDSWEKPPCGENEEAQ